MRVFLSSSFLLAIIVAQGVAVQATSAKAGSPAKATTVVGRWQVKFTLVGGNEKNLVFDARAKGAGSLLLLNTGPDNKPVAASQPAAWSQMTNDRVSISGEVELPIGTCCREMGTLIFKGKFVSSNSISGRLIFVTSVDDDESPYKFRSTVGTFTATRLPIR